MFSRKKACTYVSVRMAYVNKIIIFYVLNMVHYNKARFIHIVALIILMPIPLILRIIYSLKAKEEIKSIDGEIKSFVTDGDILHGDNKTEEVWIKGKFSNVAVYVVKIFLDSKLCSKVHTGFVLV